MARRIPPSLPHERRRFTFHLTPLTIVGIYAFVGSLWIFGSDQLLDLLISDRDQILHLSVVKGWGYIGLTAYLLYALIRYHVTTLNHSYGVLRRSEAQLQALLDNFPAIIYIKDLEGRYLLINDQFTRLFGLDREAVLGQTDYDIFPPAVADTLRTHDRAVLLTGTPLECEEQAPLPDGWHIYLTNKFPLSDPARGVYAVGGISTDISARVHSETERKQAELEIQRLNETLEAQVLQRTAELEVANQQLQAMNHELDAFSYSVSHDLRAPLRHINGFLSILTQHLEDQGVLLDAEAVRYLEMMRQSSEKMGTLVESLLALSRVGRQPLVTRPVPLRPLVERAIALVKPHIDFELDPTEFVVEDLPTVIGDATLLQQVFSNLIDNAVKFSRPSRLPSKPPGYGARIEVNALPNGTVYVKDNGVGLPMEASDQLFGAFQRLHSQQDFEGTGIGLAIVQRIVHRHGGTIWVESTVGQGACFYFNLGSASEL
uniref:sensor histidine kinase n=1 Tax=Trichocoleus desertorum TaxID=1481672 RepID=UPI0025B373B3|nr:ATP-binding protein [Trichocoleus desertorum]